MFPSKNAEPSEILNLLDKDLGPDPSPEDRIKLLTDYFGQGREEQVSLLGIDIYKYSSFPLEKQRLLPFLFDEIYANVLRRSLETEQFLFSTTNRGQLEEHFISTGDGGFQVLQNPLQCLIFTFYVEMNIRLFNTGAFLKPLRDILGPISLRYAITTGSVMRFQGHLPKANFFGPVIIRNARIMAKDKLNRLLIDTKTNDWFLTNTSGIESLRVLSYGDFAPIYGVKSVPDAGDIAKNFFFAPGSDRLFVSQKIETLFSKEATFDVFNIYVQRPIAYRGPASGQTVLAVGNLNPLGLNEK